ncbi:MAG: chromosome segregation protein SMC [Acidobacteria bacterium]|nr:chromosome segregation protein SMC [Acidobacteriota bacterium]
MLKLKRVEIQGFKSFCDRTEMKFHGEGVAAIVGPNGCGKSNLSDAISWVLGEQSAKSLRGARMEDVIFAGTRDRKPLGMAQVTMTLVDPGYHLDKEAKPEVPVAEGAAVPIDSAKPIEHFGKAKEITITRRLFRNGESEYLIDGKQARLRDIQDLFMGTGLGPESYAIIEQGRIGQILSNKPADRRNVIEEAAGVGRFKARRRLAEAKLEGAKQNLNRVFDILEEVGRQANSLKRQAAKAKRFEELRGEYVAQLRFAIAGRFQILDREITKTALDLNVATEQLSTANQEVAVGDTQTATLRQQCFATEAELTESRRKLSELQLEAERTRGRLESQARQIAAIEQRLQQAETESADVETRLADRKAEHASHIAQGAEVSNELSAARTTLHAKTTERDALQNELRQREREAENARQQVLRLMGEASALKNQLAQADGYMQSLDRDSARITRDEESGVAEIARLEALKASLAERATARQQELATVGAERKRVDGELNAKRQQQGESRRLVDERRADLSRTKARKDSLNEILSHRAYTTESVKRLFTAIERGQGGGLKPMGVLADFVEVDRNYEKATEEFLHEELEYVLVHDWAAAQQGVELMRSDLDGRATFLVHPPPQSELLRGPVAEPPVGPDTGIAARLSDVLRLTNGLTEAPAELLPRLSRCFLATDRNAAQRLALEYPDVYFLLPDGVCYHGYAVSGGKKSSSGPLALKRELRELTTLERTKQVALDEAIARQAQLEAEITALAEQLEKLRQQQQTQEKDALAIDHESRKMSEELQRANSRLNVARNDLQRLQRDRERSLAQLEQRRQAVAEKEAAGAEVEKALLATRSSVEELQRKAAHLGEEHSALRAGLASLEERARSAQSAAQRLESQVRELAHRRQFLSTEMERLGVDRQRLLNDNMGLDSRSSELNEAIGTLATAVREMATREAEQKTALAATDLQMKTLRATAQQLAERRSQIEIELVRRQSDLKHLEENCRNQLDLSAAEVSAAVDRTFDEVALAEAEDKVKDLNRRIEGLGPVNTQALEEYEEAQRRYDFLNTQRQDLLDSIRDTEKAIQEIDVESKRRFNEAFEKINAYFRDMFKTLFNGGLGEMRLTDQENVNESGIDLVAQPPGKKLQNVLLLSGGERAMTAMALLMAIFKYQPSPFCILDEVDAPLDEPNIMRLSALLKEMSSQTQFIVITHAKRTMESAQAMYGVTMQEPGVSKLVSVRFKEASRPAAA